ncbi:MAG: MFS transporter, partial [Ignavibacteriaceae bacterium]
EQIILIFVLHIIISFVMAPQAPLLWAMYADTADYSEWKNNRRATGLVFSAATFSQKMGMAVGGGLAGWLLAYFGFVANAQQTAGTLDGIKMMMSFIPALGSLIALIAAFFYELDENKMKNIEMELNARKAEAIIQS